MIGWGTPEQVARDAYAMRCAGYVLPKDAATAFRRPERTIRTWMRDGKVSTRRLGRRVYVRADDIRAANATATRRVAAQRNPMAGC